MRTGFYPGSFDPVTLGHADVIRRATKLVDRLVIGIGVHSSKTPLFSEDERRAMLTAEWALIRRSTDTLVDIVTFDGLTVAAAKAHEATIIIRGLRDGADLDYEMRLAGMNAAMEPSIETVFLPASPNVRHIAATLVRQIALMGGDVSPFVSSAVARQLRKRSAAR